MLIVLLPRLHTEHFDEHHPGVQNDEHLDDCRHLLPLLLLPLMHSHHLLVDEVGLLRNHDHEDGLLIRLKQLPLLLLLMHMHHHHEQLTDLKNEMLLVNNEVVLRNVLMLLLMNTYGMNDYMYGLLLGDFEDHLEHQYE